MMKLTSSIRAFFGDPDWLPKTVNVCFGVIALCCIVLGFLMPWYALPQLDLASNRYDHSDGFFTVPFKVLLVIGMVLCLVGVFRRKKGSRGALLLRFSSVSMLLLLVYPTVLTVFDSETVGDGAWLQQQHDTMTWLGGDVYRAHSERNVESGMGANAQDPPERLAVFRPPTGSLGLDRLNDWIWWLGYGPAWTQFAGKGWFCAVIGYGLLSVYLIGRFWRINIPATRTLLKKLVVQHLFIVTIGLSLVLILVAITRQFLRQSETAVAEADYGKALQKLELATAIIPSLRNDSGIIFQRGYCRLRIGEHDHPEARLYQIYRLDQEGYQDRNRALVNRLHRQRGDLPRNLSRELSRQQLRMAVNDINSSKTTSALVLLDDLIKNETNCIQAHFHKQLTTLQSDDLEGCREANERLVILYHGFKSKNKRGVIAASDWLLAQAESKVGNVPEAWRARIDSKGR